MKTDRRKFLFGAAAGAASLAAPLRVAAQAAPDQRTRKIVDKAVSELARAAHAVSRRDVVAIADFGLHSSEPRFHIVNLEAGRMRSFLVTHGAGSDPEHDGWLNAFSNVNGSNATSRGAYVTEQLYHGKYGASMRLEGLERDNSNAYSRAIVMHPATYATQDFVNQHGRLGRSNGCFAMGDAEMTHTLNALQGGTLLFADRLGIGPGGAQVQAPRQRNLNLG
ncbi:murein L,D-transpeptidase catalytic domain family protein [Alteraurantiacibacter aquimixticola]|uniref:Murein L,D-transpeptidase catalytic domain family protein n=1 Tax=Alteraurantiacibacter aquimixticola TaxID=2489173 RepID=A0A4T3F617_9SPHN|nr:murein L,D-transpeptidase catalytic domain family protein [Alteraurantiacibacter aquimixticola]TIX51082.1 murein L,D-transpeptidase catalytic domain family protein [Alteraurantiacibacter aquimixticola]